MSEATSVETRIARLKRQNRRMRSTVLAVCALAAMALVYRATPLASQSTEVRATKIILTDKDGNGHAGLVMGGDNEPSLVLIDKRGKAGVTIGTGDTSAYINLVGPASPFELTIQAAKDFIDLRMDQGNDARVILQTKPDVSTLLMWGKIGPNRVQVVAAGDKSDAVIIDEKGDAMWHAETTKKP